jgi:hypothetical protein
MRNAGFGLGLGALVAFAAPAHAVLLHNYDLNGSLTDSKGGPSLLANGGVLGRTGYTFGANQGLSLSGLDLAATGDYTIEIGFSFDVLSGYRKIIDFSNLGSDAGLYSLGSSLNFFPLRTGPQDVFLVGQLVNLVLTRTSAGDVKGSVNGVDQITFFDTGGLALSNTLNFFRDDRITGFGEASSGFVDYIRISNSAPPSAVPLPAALPLLLAGLAGLGVVGRRRKRAE